MTWEQRPCFAISNASSESKSYGQPDSPTAALLGSLRAGALRRTVITKLGISHYHRMKLAASIPIVAFLLMACASEYVVQKDGTAAYVARDGFGNAMVFPIPGSDARTLKTFPKTRYALDKNHVYYGQSAVPNANPRSFQALSEHHGSDDANVYHRSEQIGGADPSTFKVLDYWFGKDRLSVFGGSKKYPACDTESFQILKYGWSRDAKCVFSRRGPEPELDAFSFEPYSETCGKDKSGYFNRFRQKRSDSPEGC